MWSVITVAIAQPKGFAPRTATHDCRYIAINGSRELSESCIAVFSKHVRASLYSTHAAVEHLPQLATHYVC